MEYPRARSNCCRASSATSTISIRARKSPSPNTTTAAVITSSGGIAQADVLGILGREGVFAAAWWDVGNGSSYVNAAFNMYRNYDGTGGKFGDTSVQATTSNIANSAVYASVDADNPNRMVLVAINRTNQPLDAAIAVSDDNRFVLAQVYKLMSTIGHAGSWDRSGRQRWESIQLPNARDERHHARTYDFVR